jgi:hypothetical protein
VLLLSCSPSSLGAQHHDEDPLSETQSDQVRELGNQPNERVKLYLRFVDDRISAIRELAVDAGENHRPYDLRAKYEEFTRLSDELADNIDTYATDHADIRKSLRAVLESCTKWSAALSKPPQNPVYEFARKTALDAAQSTVDDTRKLLAEQDAYFATHKAEAGKNGRAPSAPE